MLQIPDHAAYDCLGRLVLGSSISPDDWQRFIDNSDVLRISKGTRMIEAGEHVNHVYFCVHGLFRLFYILEDGSEYNITFSLENDFITSCGAMVQGKTSPYSAEAMEPSVVIRIGWTRVQTRFFDAEALPGRDYTDFVVCETEDLKAYHFMWEEIRDYAVYTNGWMRIKNVVMGMENAFQSYEKEILKMQVHGHHA